MSDLFRVPLHTRIEAKPTQQPDFYVNNNPTLLLGKDTFYGAQGEVPDYDWQLPVVPKIVNTTYVYYPPNVTILLPSPTLPKSRITDFPNPILRKSDGQQGYTYRAVNLDFPTSLPFGNYDFPNPILRNGPVTNLTNIFYYVFDTTVFPQFNFDFPNPIVNPALRIRQDFINESPTFTLSPPLPFYQYEWPNPILALKIQNYHTFGATLARIPIGATPKNQMDWPNPLVARSNTYNPPVLNNMTNIQNPPAPPSTSAWNALSGMSTGGYTGGGDIDN